MGRSLIAWSVGLIGLATLTWTLLPQADGFPMYYDAWLQRYPNSTLPQRMLARTGSECHTCHHPPNRFDPGTCYREDIIRELSMGRTIEQALANIENQDSDGDGVPNGVEINLVRSDLPGQVGYHPGLVGDLGTDPCGENPSQPVTQQRETPPPCPGDVNGDRTVDQSDLGILLANWMQSVPPNRNGDLNGDGRVDQQDLGILLANWQRTCPG